MSKLILGRYRRHSDQRIVHLTSIGIRDNVLMAIYTCSYVEYSLPVEVFKERHQFEEIANHPQRRMYTTEILRHRQKAVKMGFDYPIDDIRYVPLNELKDFYIEMMDYIRENESY